MPHIEDKVPFRGHSKHEGWWTTYYYHYHSEIFIVDVDLIAIEINSQFNEIIGKFLTCIPCLDLRNLFSRFHHGRLLLAKIYSDD